MKEDNINYESEDSDKLLVSFGGIRNGIGMPVFEFYKSLKGIECDKIFIKDVNQAWYHKGINDEIKNIPDLQAYLSYLIDYKAYKKVVFVGNSMGAYGAILFGSLLNVDNIIAFSPQTFIGKWKRLFYGDKRWKKQIKKVHEGNLNQRKYYDLKMFLKKKKFTSNITILYSSVDKLDSIQAQNLNRIENVQFKSFSFGGHSFIKNLRDNGLLIEIITESLDL